MNPIKVRFVPYIALAAKQVFGTLPDVLVDMTEEQTKFVNSRSTTYSLILRISCEAHQNNWRQRKKLLDSMVKRKRAKKSSNLYFYW